MSQEDFIKTLAVRVKAATAEWKGADWAHKDDAGVECTHNTKCGECVEGQDDADTAAGSGLDAIFAAERGEWEDAVEALQGAVWSEEAWNVEDEAETWGPVLQFLEAHIATSVST